MLRKPDIAASGRAERGGFAPVYRRRLGAGCPAADPAGEGTGSGDYEATLRPALRGTPRIGETIGGIMSAQRGRSIRLIAMVLAVAVGGQGRTSRGTVTGTVLDP